MMISPELLSAVDEDLQIDDETNRVYYTTTDLFDVERIYVDIHKLAHMVKEWAWRTHLITIRSGYAEYGAWSNFANNNISFCSMDIPLTEPEAVFKAGEWILKEISK